VIPFEQEERDETSALPSKFSKQECEQNDSAEKSALQENTPKLTATEACSDLHNMQLSGFKLKGQFQLRNVCGSLSQQCIQ